MGYGIGNPPGGPVKGPKGGAHPKYPKGGGFGKNPKSGVPPKKNKGSSGRQPGWPFFGGFIRELSVEGTSQEQKKAQIPGYGPGPNYNPGYGPGPGYDPGPGYGPEPGYGPGPGPGEGYYGPWWWPWPNSTYGKKEKGKGTPLLRRNTPTKD